jgi:hypothetical protein
MTGRAYLSIDLLRWLQAPICGQQAVHGNTQMPFIFLQVRPDERPVLGHERRELPTVELVICDSVVRIPNIQSPARCERKEVAARIGAIQLPDVPIRVKRDTVYDNEPPAVERVTGHKGFGQIVQAGSVDDHAWPPDRIDQRSSGGVAQDEGRAAFGSIHEGLAHVAVHDQGASFHDLRELILGGVVHNNFGAVNAGSQIIAGFVA